LFLLGIDTCGPSGSVALGRLTDPSQVEVLAQRTLEGRTYSATLVFAVEELLTGHGVPLTGIGCIVVVHGPGSFTGVRVGLSAAKGLAEGAGIALIAVSRLEVLAHKAGLASAALDAHRHEIFLRVSDNGEVRELLAGESDLSQIRALSRIAVCDEAAAVLLRRACPGTEPVHIDAPTAADALSVAAPGIRAGNLADPALLDGHYLRRSDAEIFGNTVLKS